MIACFRLEPRFPNSRYTGRVQSPARSRLSSSYSRILLILFRDEGYDLNHRHDTSGSLTPRAASEHEIFVNTPPAFDASLALIV